MTGNLQSPSMTRRVFARGIDLDAEESLKIQQTPMVTTSRRLCL